MDMLEDFGTASGFMQNVLGLVMAIVIVIVLDYLGLE